MNLRDDQLTTCLDLGEFESWLALESVLELQKSVPVEINWLPLVAGLKRFSNKDELKDTDDEFQRYKQKRLSARNRYMQTNRIRYAALLGLKENDIDRQYDSTLVSICMLWVRDRFPTKLVNYMRRVFESHYRGYKDLTLESSLIDILNDLDAVEDDLVEYLHSDGAALMVVVQDELAEAGLFAAPAFWLRGERFQGREHLPLISWYLSGQKGSPPV